MLDPFGDLRAWSRVLEQLEELKETGRLDENQRGLARLLRYRFNWQVRQSALRAVPELKRPSKEIFGVLLSIVADEYCELETRLLACEAVRHMLDSGHVQGEAERAAAARCSGKLLRVPQPPLLEDAVSSWSVPASQPAWIRAGA